MKQEKPQLKYFLYARKSSESEDRQVQSIDDQIERLKHLANTQGIKTIDILTESKSAKMPGRPVFEDMLQRIENKEADGILCWQINRLSRNPIDSGKLSWLLQKGIIQSIQTIDKEYKPEDNVILFNVETGSANQFLIDLSKNVKRGMNGKAERGDYPTKPPLGYKNDRLNKKIMVDEELFPLVRSMWVMMLSGNYTPPSIKNIVKHLVDS
jgi:DNA invertase Pin-like site-specific DNA recombinase